MDIFVSRQPLFDRQRHVVAYDLHYRTGRLQAVGGNPDEIARKMVNNTMLGFGLDTLIGPVYLGTGEQHVFLGRELTQEREMSDNTLDRADEAVHRLLNEAMAKAIGLLKQYQEALDGLAHRLIDEETIDEEALIKLLGAPPAAIEVAAMEAVEAE